jgi:hypothetical protein
MIPYVTRRAVFTVLCFFVAVSADAADLPNGMSLAPTSPLYFATADTVVRDLPNSDARRLGQIDKGQHVSVTGKVVTSDTASADTGSNWLAVKRPGGAVGYARAATLVAMIDGTLKTPLAGKLSAPDRPDCRYAVSFEGHSPVADAIQQTADYNIAFECDSKGSDTPLAFNAGMFITELPFDAQRAVYQINIDLWDMRVNDEDVLSVTSLYDPAAQQVSFDHVTDDKLGDGTGVGPESAADVPAALAAAIRIAHKVWQDGAWQQLSQLPKPGPDDDDPGGLPSDKAPDDTIED